VSIFYFREESDLISRYAQRVRHIPGNCRTKEIYADDPELEFAGAALDACGGKVQNNTGYIYEKSGGQNVKIDRRVSKSRIAAQNSVQRVYAARMSDKHTAHRLVQEPAGSLTSPAGFTANGGKSQYF
jgi:hypothetical protein